MLIDLHVHSQISKQGVLDPEEIILKAKRTGLDGICFTEDQPITAWQDLLKLGEIHEAVVLLGRVFSTTQGDFLFYPANAKDAAEEPLAGFSGVGGDLPTFDLLFRALKPLGGLLAAAHPYKLQVPNPLGDRIFRLEGLDAIEVRNGSCSSLVNDFALEASFHLKLAGLGGSQTCETLSTLGKAATLFLQPVTSQEEFIAAVRSGQTWPVEIADDISLRPTPNSGGRGGRERSGGPPRGGDRRGRDGGSGRSSGRPRDGRSGGGNRR